MRRVLILIILLLVVTIPVNAMDFTAPTVPESALDSMPEEPESFSEGLWFIIKSAIHTLQPQIAKAASISMAAMVICILVCLLQSFSKNMEEICKLAGTVFLGVLLINHTDSMIQNGTRIITQISEYGKLLLPVMAGAMAAQGGSTTSASLYLGTSIFGSLLSTLITKLIVPMLYIFICLSIVYNAVGKEMLNGIRNFVKWFMTWCLKMVLYIFTGYMTLTGVISGSTDASALKVTRFTISKAIPVVGSILSDASEAVLVGASVMKNAAGIYGLLAILAICITPFLQTGVQYLLLKLTASVSSVFGTKESSSLLEDFSSAMGFVLAMMGTVCLLHLISTVCFMKGVA